MKRLFALLLAIVMVLSLPAKAQAAETSLPTTVPNMWAEGNTSRATASDLYIMATYYDTDFYSVAAYKELYLEKACIQISYRCTIQNDNYDAMHIVITDLNGGGYDKYLTMEGDGASHTMYLYLPAGRYGVQLTGNFMLHIRGAINFKGYA